MLGFSPAGIKNSILESWFPTFVKASVDRLGPLRKEGCTLDGWSRGSAEYLRHALPSRAKRKLRAQAGCSRSYTASPTKIHTAVPSTAKANTRRNVSAGSNPFAYKPAVIPAREPNRKLAFVAVQSESVLSRFATKAAAQKE